MARKVGMDAKAFRKRLRDATLGKKVTRLKSVGIEAGIEGTPAFFINGRRYEREADFFSLKDRVAMELDRQEGNCQ
jgi:protein-disulfide isomerase